MAEAAGDLGNAGDGAADAGKALHATDSAPSNVDAHTATDNAVVTKRNAVAKTATSDAANSTAVHDGAYAASQAADSAGNATTTPIIGAEKAPAANDVSISSPSRKPTVWSSTKLTTTHPPDATQSSKLTGGDSKEVNLQVSIDRRIHILDGDGTGGGHRAGTGKAGKSEFPSTWSDDKTIKNLESVANDPKSIRTAGRNGRTIIRGQRDGIDLEVIVGKKDEIITGYPTNLP